jgi:PAS domain S-box-containing protein
VSADYDKSSLGHPRPSREELEAENARLRAALAQARLDTDSTAAGNARMAKAGRDELLVSSALNDELRRTNSELEASRAALAESEDRYRSVVESATDYAIITTDTEGRITSWNTGAWRVLGWDEAEVLGRDGALIFTPEDRETGQPEAERLAARDHGAVADERWHMRRDGSRFWAQGQLTQLRGSLRGYLTILRDHTEQRRAEERVRAGEAFLRTVLDASLDCTVVVEPDGCLSYMNASGLRLMDLDGIEAVRGREWAVLWPEPARTRVHDAVAAALAGDPSRFAAFGPTAKGTPKWWDVTVAPVPGAGGQVARVVAMARDVTDARQAEQVLRESEERHRAIIESATEYAIFTLHRDGRVTSWNVGAKRILGWEASEIIGRDAALLYTPEDQVADEPRTEMQAALAEGHVDGGRWMLRRDGKRFWATQTLTRLLDGDGEERGFLKILRDRTEARVAEERLRESETRFRHMADSAPALIWTTDAAGQVAFANMHFDHVFGRPASEMLGEGWAEVVLADDLGSFRAAFVGAFHAGRPFRTEVRVRDRDGQVRWMRCEGVPRLDDAGNFLGYTGCAVDISDARLAAEELERRVAARTAELSQALGQLHEEVLERERVEDALRQSHKMEAVGQLTGGIAHDFNNMLQAIGGSLEMMRRRVEQGRPEEAGRYVEGARRTVERAAALTHRLLAFARRQALAPKLVEPDTLVEGMAELIRRTVGPAIQVELRIRGGIWTVLCDPSQLENALLNLAINARDAMPDGGTLTISTQHVRLSAMDVAGEEGVEPGEYIEIAVTDTGAGMDEVTRSRAFEPFFTTKPLGQGTGLGLSQLYGFARQSDGVVRLDSVPGQGTTVRLYLPRHARIGMAQEVGSGQAEARQAGAGETVLLVEDEAQVRELVAEALRELGYDVMEASDGPAALRVLHGSRGSRVDLLVTDVGLPGGLNGRQVADAARERRPGLPVLFVTGYAGGALEAHLAPGMAVISKPFTLDALAQRVRAMLEAIPAT